MYKFCESNQNLIFLFDLNGKNNSNFEEKIISKIKIKHKTIFFDDQMKKPLKEANQYYSISIKIQKI